MMDRILDAFRTATSQGNALNAVARILVDHNPRLSIVAGIVYADAIAWCLYTEQGDSASCATRQALYALADNGTDLIA